MQENPIKAKIGSKRAIRRNDALRRFTNPGGAKEIVGTLFRPYGVCVKTLAVELQEMKAGGSR